MKTGMRKIQCPCCGGTGKIDEHASVPLSPMQSEIFDIVRYSKHGIDRSVLTDRVYSNYADGGPISARKTVDVQIVRANARLAKINLRIGSETRGGPLQVRPIFSGA